MFEMTRIRVLIVQLTFGVTSCKDNGHLRGGSVGWHIGRGPLSILMLVCLLAVYEGDAMLQTCGGGRSFFHPIAMDAISN